MVSPFTYQLASSIKFGIGQALGTIAGLHHGRAVALALDVVYLENAEAAAEIHAKIYKIQ